MAKILIKLAVISHSEYVFSFEMECIRPVIFKQKSVFERNECSPRCIGRKICTQNWCISSGLDFIDSFAYV